MKVTSSIVTLLISTMAMMTTTTHAIDLEYFGPNPDPAEVTYPLSQCQGGCSSDAHVRRSLCPPRSLLGREIGREFLK